MNGQFAHSYQDPVDLSERPFSCLNQICGLFGVSNSLSKAADLGPQSLTVNDNNRDAINAEFVQLNAEIDRIASATSYNGSTLLSGFGNAVSQNVVASTALASGTTGVIDVGLNGADSGTYTFEDTSAVDNKITLGNGVVTQTISLGPALDNDGIGGVVATGTSLIANFDRLGIALTLTGQRGTTSNSPASDGYRDGDLDGLGFVIEGNQATIQVGADANADWS